MGAMVGGLYASGHLEEFADWVTHLSQSSVIGLMDPSLRTPGLIKAERVMKKVRQMLKGARIEDLAIPYTAVATDLMHSKEVWFQEGPLDTAIRASIAMPSLISAVTIGGRLMADGGLLNPLPIAPLASHNADLLVAISLSGPSAESLGSPLLISSDAKSRDLKTDRSNLAKIPRKINSFDVLNQAIETMQVLITRYRTAGYPPDLMVEIPIDSVGMLDFHKAINQIELGRMLTAQTLDEVNG
jgi:NTE family protein